MHKSEFVFCFVLFRKKAKGACVSDVCYSFLHGKEKGIDVYATQS